MTSQKRAILYQNAKALLAEDGQVIIDFIDAAGLALSDREMWIGISFDPLSAPKVDPAQRDESVATKLGISYFAGVNVVRRKGAIIGAETQRDSVFYVAAR